MGGGLMQLVAYGAQDIYLTGQPQITFFKSVYRRHTNFAMESVEQTINGQLGSGKRVTVTLARNGDLVSDVHLDYNPAAVGDFFNSQSGLYSHFHMLSSAELEIGGQLVDRIYPDWMKIWASLTIGKSRDAASAASLETDTLAVTMVWTGSSLVPAIVPSSPSSSTSGTTPVLLSPSLPSSITRLRLSLNSLVLDRLLP